MSVGARDASASSLVIHNIVVGGHRTSVRLEPVMWDALRDIARHQGMTIHDLVTDIYRERLASSLTAAIRVYIVDFYRSAARRAGQPLPAGQRFEPAARGRPRQLV